jgi:hypothetical protein
MAPASARPTEECTTHDLTPRHVTFEREDAMHDHEATSTRSYGNPLGISRREVLVVGGVALVATLFADEPALAQAPAGATAKTGGTKPVFVAQADDPVSFSVADNLFWNDIFMEHAVFFTMLMPGPELATQRARAEKFKGQFEAQFKRAQAASLDKSNYAAFNASTVEIVKPFIDFKREMQEAQQAGRLKSLVWPLFFDHTAREAERFVRRIDQLSKGHADLDTAEVVDFWARIMDEHAEFIAHLLDPQEDPLIEKALASSKAFRELRAKKGSKAEADALARSIIDFKTAAGKGITAGQIKSIIPPPLADHVRREAVKFEDELRRA